MGIASLYEDFGSQVAEISAPLPGGTDEIEEQKLVAFEKGYGAGWEDAVKVQTEGSQVVSDALKQSLLDLSFTREEALQAYVKAMRPLLERILTKVLPKLADQALLHHIVTLLEQTLSNSSDLPVEIRVAPEHQTVVAKLVDGLLPEGGQIRADTALSSKQAKFSFGESESQIDLETLINDIRGAISEFHITSQGEATDG
jgi:flagellar assembly protein FliH